MKKRLSLRVLYALRDLQSRRMFSVLRRYSAGSVLDVGGWDFFQTAKEKKVPYGSWICLEYDERSLSDFSDKEYTLVYGDGCNMDFEDGSFETVLCIQVLEHVVEPIKMVEEIARVLKPGSHAVFLAPQTGVVHLEPHHYCNFTAFWFREVLPRSGLEIVEQIPLGGRWSSTASHMFYFVWQTWERRLKSPTGEPRRPLFFVLYPLMVLYAIINLPICLFLSLGDLSEEANNHLVVARKPVDTDV